MKEDIENLISDIWIPAQAFLQGAVLLVAFYIAACLIFSL
jgi:hypothetical protein